MDKLNKLNYFFILFKEKSIYNSQQKMYSEFLNSEIEEVKTQSLSSLEIGKYVVSDIKILNSEHGKFVVADVLDKNDNHRDIKFPSSFIDKMEKNSILLGKPIGLIYKGKKKSVRGNEYFNYDLIQLPTDHDADII